ncbi:hypothetical protein [Granulicella sp. S156]|uniref:hypothetical protein n=1 Tax=Granulicella sp. S156 TaxID=1747224 RepID=UPI00131EB974|nr:hypothetical protein [Granulicella sp. S156]
MPRIDDTLSRIRRHADIIDRIDPTAFSDCDEAVLKLQNQNSEFWSDLPRVLYVVSRFIFTELKQQGLDKHPLSDYQDRIARILNALEHPTLIVLLVDLVFQRAGQGEDALNVLDEALVVAVACQS